jgi:hypothetical protein
MTLAQTMTNRSNPTSILPRPESRFRDRTGTPSAKVDRNLPENAFVHLEKRKLKELCVPTLFPFPHILTHFPVAAFI